ncbi:NAD(P)/FAD-dependent oxidoreductase [Roseivirga sp. UBA838]|uniref:NAD(P)/FAD-dependent oxidoreductase n=1 Tax=Roseivirga sp. UBA838 TaxID=1947393 RepID=UPI00257EF950|nr:NAD(P)/FAD-dependent oxidoreductase [Roseivirga sp. UBA838]
MKEIVIIGGGLSGLISAIELNRAGFSVHLFEKKKYPFHRVCGEYISNEVLPYMKRSGLLPKSVEPAQINRFEFTSIKGKSLRLPLDLGGFGLSRYTLDQHLAHLAIEEGVQLIQQVGVVSCEFEEEQFRLQTSDGQKLTAPLVIGAYGKRSLLDTRLQRSFIHQKTDFLGVKYHIRTDFPRDQISLHNFEGGYCGISAIENGTYNLCYMGSRDRLKKYGSIEAMEQAVLFKNPFLRSIFLYSDFVLEKPEVINAFSFAPKKPIEKHILMAGDAAGLITPLCGNGMAMAIHSGKILSDLVAKHWPHSTLQRPLLEREYTHVWSALFRKRLWVGRQTQQLFGSAWSSELAVNAMKHLPFLAKAIMRNTHGKPF